MAEIAAYTYAFLMGIVILFQFCLTLGLPWGAASMGGKFPGKYPPRMRMVSFLNMPVLGFAAGIVLARAGLHFNGLRSMSGTGIWFVVGFSAVSVFLNSITPSRIERAIWVPVTSVHLITSVIVALT